MGSDIAFFLFSPWMSRICWKMGNKRIVRISQANKQWAEFNWFSIGSWYDIRTYCWNETWTTSFSDWSVSTDNRGTRNAPDVLYTITCEMWGDLSLLSTRKDGKMTWMSCGESQFASPKHTFRLIHFHFPTYFYYKDLVRLEIENRSDVAHHNYSNILKLPILC